MEKKAVLVTGAAGFIGSHLCEALLKAGFTVVGIDNFDNFYSRSLKEDNIRALRLAASFHMIEGDAGDINVLNTIPYPVGTIVHLAAKAGVQPSLKDPQAYIHSNIAMTNTILEWMRIKKMNKLVFASSSSVYGNNAKIPFEESDQVNEPISPYAFTKRSSELMNYSYHKLYGFDIVNLRFFTVYGERQRPDLAIRKFAGNILSGKPITVYGDGKTARDYTYYADTVDGIVSAVDYVNKNTGVFETFNLGNHNPVYLIDLVNAISRAAGIEPIIVYEETKPGDVDITYASIEKATEQLGYQPKVDLQTGLENFINWYKKLDILLKK